MKAWTSLLRHIRVLNVALIAASSTVAFAQSGYDISFGSVPAFFTGTGNTLNLHVHTYSPNRINRIEVSIGGVEVFDEQWSWNDNKVHRPVDVDWSSEYFSHGTNVAFTAVVTLWTSSTTTQVLNFSTTAKPVYNKYAMVADTSLPLSASAAPTIASFLSNLDYAEEGYLVDNDWDADDFLGTGDGIGNATVIHVTCHGNTLSGAGFLGPPAGSADIWAQDIEDSVLVGQPNSRPPLNFAFIGSCCTMLDAGFGESFFAGANGTRNRATIGFKQTVYDDNLEDFSVALFGKLKNGKALAIAAEEAYDLVSWFGGVKQDAMLVMYGDDGFKLRGAYRGLGGGDEYNEWVYVYPEDN